MNRPSEVDFAQDKGAAKEFLPLQAALTDLLKEKGALGRLDKLRGNATLPKLELASDKVERFANNDNALITDKDGTVKGMVHQGKVFKIDPDGTVRDKNGKVIKGMHYDDASKTVTFKSPDGKLKMVFDPKNDKTTIDDAKSKSHIEITKQGITESQDGKLRRFIPTDRSFSVDIDETGKASVKGKDGKPMVAGDPNKDLADKIDGKKVEPFTTPDGQIGFKMKDQPAAGKDTNVFPGSHTVIWDRDKKRPDRIEIGKRTWDFKDVPGDKVEIKSNDVPARTFTVPKADLTVDENGKFVAKLGPNEKLEVDPVKGSDTYTKDNKSTTKFAERPGHQPYTVEREKGADDKWGVTKVVDDKTGKSWDIKYKPPGDRDPAKVDEVSIPGGTFKKDAKVAGFDVKENGEITVNFKPGEKFKSVTFKPDSNQETYVAKEGHKINVTYAETGDAAHKAFRPTVVKEGKHTYEAQYADDGTVKSLKVDGKEIKTGAAAPDAKGIEYDPNTKGFRVTQHDGKIVEYDPLRRSERLIDGKVTKETFEDRGGKKHEVVTEEKDAGKKFIRSFTDTNGNLFKVTYKDDTDPSKGIKEIQGKDGKPLPLLATFKARYGDPTITVGDDGSYTLTSPDGRTNFTKHPQGNSEFNSPKYCEVRNRDGLVTETTLPRLGGAPGGLVIERGAGRGELRPVQSLTLKDSGETLTRNPRTGDYEYRDPKNPDKPIIVNASVVCDANGKITINGRPLERDPSGADILALLKAPPVDGRGPSPRDFYRHMGIATNRKHFEGPEVIPNGVRWNDGTTVTTERTAFGTVTTTRDGVTGKEVKYTQDRAGHLMQIDNPDGSVWKRVGSARNGFEIWKDNSVPPIEVYAKTEGPGLGLDKFGFFHFVRVDQTPYGPIPVNYACAPSFINMYENQYAHAQRTGKFKPMLPPWMMPPNPMFARRFNPRAPRLLI